MKRLLSILLTIMLMAALVSPVSAQAASVSLNKKKITLNYGDTYQLTLKGAKAGKVTWTSSDENYLIVNSSGLCFAISADYSDREFTVTATYKDVEYKCTVTIPTIKALEPDGLLYTGDTFQLGFSGGSYAGEKITAAYDADGNTVSTRKAISKIVTIDDNGLVTAVGPGKVEIKLYTTSLFTDSVTLEIRTPKTDVEKAYDKLAEWMIENGTKSSSIYAYAYTKGTLGYVIRYSAQEERFEFTYGDFGETNWDNQVFFYVDMDDVRKGDDYSIDLRYYYIKMNSYGEYLNNGYIAEATIVPQKYKKGAKCNFAITACAVFTESYAKSKLSSIESMSQNLFNSLNSTMLPKAGLTLKDLGFKNY